MFQTCFNDPECTWWTYDLGGGNKFCTILRTCTFIDPDCLTCISGQSGCWVTTAPDIPDYLGKIQLDKITKVVSTSCSAVSKILGRWDFSAQNTKLGSHQSCFDAKVPASFFQCLKIGSFSPKELIFFFFLFLRL